MRVIAGKCRSLPLKTVPGTDTRPTTDRIKETLFNILNPRISGCRFLDLFSGSGAIGIEALSRGARFCVFVDSSRDSQNIVRQNLQTTGLAKQSRVAAMDYGAFLRSTGEVFDIALLDPPYGKGLLQEALPLLAPRMSPGGAILCESPRGEALPEEAGGFRIKKTYSYGKIVLTLYRRPEEE